MHSSWYVSRPVVFGTLISFIAALLAPPAPVLAQDGSAATASSYEEARDELAAVMRAVRQHRDRLDESGFDPAAKARALGTDPAVLFRYVRDEIAFEPYRGVVRFAAGALMSQAANACDRSLLLGAMLREAGYEVRYAFAQLPEPVAERLAGGTRPGAPLIARLTPFPVTDGNTDLYRSIGLSDAEIEADQRAAEEWTASFVDALSAGFAFDYGLIRARLEEANIPFGEAPNDELKQLVADSREHCWVQALVDGTWRDFDASLPENEPGTRLAEPAAVSESIPVETAHRLRFVVSLERTGADQAEAVVLDQTIVLDQAVTHISLSLTPEIFGGSASARMSEPGFVDALKVLIPVLEVGDAQAVGEPFTLEGEVLPSDPNARIATEARKPIEGGFEGAVSILDQIGADISGESAAPELPAPQLAAVAVAITHLRPDGTEQTMVREVARRAGDGNAEADRTFRTELLAGMDVLASASRIEQGFVDAKYLDMLTASRPVLFAALDDQFGRTTSNKDEVLDRDAVTYPFALLNLLRTRRALLDFMAAWHFPGLIAYAAEPMIAVQRDRLRTDADGAPLLVTSFDILSNPVRAIDARASLPGDRAPYFRLAQGVVDTLAEYLALGGGEAVNAHSVLARAVAENSPLILLSADDPAALASVEAGPTEKAAIEADLARGFAVLAPARAVALAGKPAFAWWRVDPRSGAALGIGAEGQGQSMTERIIIDGIVIGTICAGFTWYETSGTNASAGKSFLKCMVISIILVPVGLGLHKLAGVLVRRIAARLGMGAAAAAGAAGAAAAGAGARGTAAGEAAGAGARGTAAGEAGAAGGGKVRSGPTDKVAIEVPSEPRPSGSGPSRSGAGESGSGTVAVGRRDGQTLPGTLRNPAAQGGKRGGAFEAAGGGRGPARGAREPAGGQEPAGGSGKFDEAAIDRTAREAGERAAAYDVEPRINPAEAANDAVIPAAKGLDPKAIDMGVAWNQGVPIDRVTRASGMSRAEARAALDRYLEQGQGVTDKAARDRAIREYEAIQNYEKPKRGFVDNPLADAIRREAQAAREQAEAAARARENYDPFRDLIPADEGIPLSESDIRAMGQAPEPPPVDPKAVTGEVPQPGTETQALPNQSNPQ